jgi:hypothetical protein
MLVNNRRRESLGAADPYSNQSMSQIIKEARKVKGGYNEKLNQSMAIDQNSYEDSIDFPEGSTTLNPSNSLLKRMSVDSSSGLPSLLKTRNLNNNSMVENNSIYNDMSTLQQS